MGLSIARPRRSHEIARLQRLVDQARDNWRADIAFERAKTRRIQQEAGAKLAETIAERDRLQRRVLVLERQSVARGRTIDRLQRRIDAYEIETARQFRLIERLQRDLMLAKGLPPVDAEVSP